MRVARVLETMLLVELTPRIDERVNRQVIALAERLRQRTLTGVRDIVPAYGTVGIHFDPLQTDAAALEVAVAREGREVEAADDGDVDVGSGVTASQPVEIPVRYGGDDGPDLGAVAAWAGCSTDEVVARHAAGVYRVYMLGFVPGFAYLGTVDSSIAMPRHRTPRERVPVGSVGIAGAQTGIYPLETPGGWQIIGRTDVRMFDATRTPATLLAAGDRVRFTPLSGAGR